MISGLGSGLRCRDRLGVIRCPETAAYGWPAVNPIQRIEQHRSFRKTDSAVKIRIVAIHRVINSPPLSVEILKYGIMPEPHPAIAIHAKDGRSTHFILQQGGALTVNIWTEDILRTADKDAVAGQRTAAAICGRNEQVPVTVVVYNLGTFIAVRNGNLDLGCRIGMEAICA